MPGRGGLHPRNIHFLKPATEGALILGCMDLDVAYALPCHFVMGLLHGLTRAKGVAAAAAKLNELRKNWLNPSELVKREPEVVPGYPDRVLAQSLAAEAQLKKRTLTNLYNERPSWLANAHRDLDRAVLSA